MADLLNPTTPGVTVSPYPPEFQQEAAALQRRRALADLMLMRSLQPMQQATGYGGNPVPTSPFAGLSQIAQAGIGAGAQKGLDEAQGGLATKYASGLAGAVERMQEAMKTGDYKGAATIAQPWPALKAISEKLMERQLPKFGVHEGVAFNENAPDPLAGGRPVDPRVPITQNIASPGGTTTIQGTRGAVTGKEAFPPANITNVQNFPANTMATEAAKGQAGLLYGEKGTLPQSRTEAEAAQRDLSLLLNVNDLAKDARFGSFQEWRNAVVKVAQTAGFTESKEGDKTIGASDNMFRQLAGRSLEVAKKLGSGSGFSNTDLAFLQRVRAGVDLDEAGMRRFMELAVEADIKAIHQHNSQVEASPEALPGFKQAYRVNIPSDFDAALQKGLKLGPPTSYERAQAPGSVPGAPMSLDDYLRSRTPQPGAR